MRAFVILIVAVLLAIGIAMLVATNDQRSGVGISRGTTSTPVVLLGDGVGGARFGQRASTVIAAAERLFGQPMHAVQSQSDEDNCGVDSSLSWSTFELYFFHRRFVGYAAGTYSLQPIDAATAAGLRIGTTVAKARQIYGAHLRTSTEQSGSWFATTPSGTVDGFLSRGSHSIGH